MSVYRDDEAWDRWLRRDLRLIDKRLDEEQKRVLKGVPGVVARSFPIDFVLVVGSRARGDHRGDSDLDLFIDTEMSC